MINLDAESVSFKATQFNTMQLQDNESDLEAILNFKEPTFIFGRDSNDNSREWISSGLKGTEFMTYIHRYADQKITIYTLENSNVRIYKGGTEGPVTFSKNTGESLHVSCFETGKWSVVAHI